MDKICANDCLFIEIAKQHRMDSTLQPVGIFTLTDV